jgi:hypothetical protein
MVPREANDFESAVVADEMLSKPSGIVRAAVIYEEELSIRVGKSS